MDNFDDFVGTASLFDASSQISLPRPPPPSPASPIASTRLLDHSIDAKTVQVSSERISYRTPPSCALRHFNASLSYSSDEASEDGDDVPPTPADLNSFRSITLAPRQYLGEGGGEELERGRVEMSNLFTTRSVGANAATFEEDGSLSLSPIANVFYPSFGDFLPAIKKQEEAIKANGLGLGDWEATTADKIDSLTHALTRELKMYGEAVDNVDGEGKVAHLASPTTDSSVFAPFATFSPNTDSFTFFPSPEWKSNKRDRGPKEEEEVVASSAALLSPQPNLDLSAFPMQKSLSASHVGLARTQVVITPPATPARNVGYRSTAPSMRQSRSLPIPASLSPSRSPFANGPSPSPTRSSFSQPSHPFQQYVPTPAYPLSPIDTERIAKLHNGRIPTLEQLCPEPIHPSAQPPIVNTGNQGVMVVQQGDWKCGTCSFVNWRRRKICLRCFPFANDIGNILTIQSQRAAHLATPMSAPAHQTHFLLPSPTRSHFDHSSPTTSMARSTSYASSPDRSQPGYGQSYLLLPPAPPQMPHSASPTRTTFALQPPPSPTRYMNSPASSSPVYPSPYQSSDEERFYSTPSTSPSSTLSSLAAASSGDLALRRAAKFQQSSSDSRRHPSIQPLNLANYNQQMHYAQSQASPTSSRGRGPYSQQQQSPPSPTRYLSQQRTFSNGMIGAEL